MNGSTSTITSTYLIATIVYFIFMIWAVFLALKVKDQQTRILHVTLALFTGPAYVFGYYLSLI